MKVIQSFASESAWSARIHDLIKEFADFLSSEGLKGNFHLTGDFARALRRHARHDVISSLSRHEIGYHCNHHGGRPFMAGYCEESSWKDGVSRWLYEELPGVRILEELFERSPAYYTTEFQKAPQVVYGSWLAGIPSTGILLGNVPSKKPSPLPDGGQGAAWYCNSFVPTSKYLFSPDIDTEDFEQAVRRTTESRLAELDKRTGVLRSFTHEYPFIKDPKKPMSGSTYKNTHYEEISLPELPEKKIADKVGRFKNMIHILRGYPGVQFISYTEYLKHWYYPGHGHWLNMKEMDILADSLKDTIDAVMLADKSVSPAEACGLIVRVLRAYIETGHWPNQVAVQSLIGPVEEYADCLPARTVSSERLLESIKYWDRSMDSEGCIPALIDIGGEKLYPGQWLQSLARIYAHIRSGKDRQLLKGIDCPADAMPAIADDPFFLETVFSRPEHYPPDFTGERICRMCRLQSWSWKPAVIRS